MKGHCVHCGKIHFFFSAIAQIRFISFHSEVMIHMIHNFDPDGTEEDKLHHSKTVREKHLLNPEKIQ